MPQLGDVAVQTDGSEIILTSKGWVPNTTKLETASAMGMTGALAAGIVDIASLGLARTPEELSQVSPVSSVVPDAALLLSGLPGITRVGSMAGRVSRRRAEASGGLVRRPSDIAGRATATGQGLQRVEAAAEVIPGLNIPLLMQKAVNQRRINMAGAKALGVSDDAVNQARFGITDDILAESRAGFKEGFDAVEEGITKRINQIDTVTVMDQVIDSKLVGPFLSKSLQGKSAYTGKELMAVRSKLTDLVQSNAEFQAKEAASEIIDAIDDIVEQALTTEGRKSYQQLRSRYRVWANMRRGRGLSGDGQVNVKTIGGRFANNYGDNYRTILAEGSEGIPGAADDVNNFLRLVREGERLDVGIPSSGTAERATGAAILGAAGFSLAGD